MRRVTPSRLKRQPRHRVRFAHQRQPDVANKTACMLAEMPLAVNPGRGDLGGRGRSLRQQFPEVLAPGASLVGLVPIQPSRRLHSETRRLVPLARSDIPKRALSVNVV